MQPKLSFVQITDSHLGPRPEFEKHGVRPLDCLSAAVDQINRFPQQPDFVIHTGDVSDDRSRESYALAGEILARLHAPLYVVNGNHDEPAALRRLMDARATARSDDPDAPLAYTFDLKGERFLVLDAFSETVEQPLGFMSDEQLQFLRYETGTDGPPLTVFVHYPPFPMGSPWLDRRMIIANGKALHEALLPARDRLRAVFTGHLHRPAQTIRDGITYLTAASVSFQYTWHQWEDAPLYDPDTPGGYTVARYFEGYIVATGYTLAGG